MRLVGGNGRRLVDAVPLGKFDWRMSDDMRNKKVKQDVFTELQLTHDVKHLLGQPVTVHVTIIPVKTITVLVFTHAHQVYFKLQILQTRMINPEQNICIHYECHIATTSTCHGHVDILATEFAALQAWNRLLKELKLLRSATASLRQKYKMYLFCLTDGIGSTAV